MINSTKRLYRVDLTIYVAANDESEARDVADESLSDVDPDILEIHETVHVLSEWYAALPYGSPDKTCAQIIAERWGE